MSQSFSISHGDFTYELEYSDLKNKQLSKLCKKTNSQISRNISISVSRYICFSVCL